MSDTYSRSGKNQCRRGMNRASPLSRKSNANNNRCCDRTLSRGNYFKRANNNRSNFFNSKFSGVKRPRTDQQRTTSFTHPLSRVDPLFAAAAAAAVMNAGLQPASTPSVDLSAFIGRPGASTAASTTVAAVAAAAMNAAAMAAALGASVPSTSNSDLLSSKRLANQLSRVFASDVGNSTGNTENRSDRNRSRIIRRLQDDTHTNTRVGRRRENKMIASQSSRFPHHLDHRNPEDDPGATRTLFVGNLVQDITETDLRRVFERYGYIEDIDIKRPEPGARINAYAFVRFINLDIAHRAKVDMSGKLIGHYNCKIGYGKVQPTRCLWIGGLGPWISYSAFTSLLDRIGKPERIIWPSGKNYANVLFPTVEMATTAADVLRGYQLGANGRRIRVDFTDEEHITHDPLAHRHHQLSLNSKIRNRRSISVDDQSTRSSRKSSYLDSSPHRERRTTTRHDRRSSSGHHSRSSAHRSANRLPAKRKKDHSTRMISFTKRYQKNSASYSDNPPLPVRSPSTKFRDTPVGVKRPITPPEDDNDSIKANIPHTLSTVTNTEQLATCLPKSWDGTFFLKSSSFPCRMHILRGDLTLVDQFVTSHDENGDESKDCAVETDQTSCKRSGELVCLRITQRMKLDPVKLDDVSQRISAAGNAGFCVLLAVPSSLACSSETNESSKQTHRPLRNLISYLRTKDSAGVVLLNPKNQAGLSTTTTDGLPITGVLHAFPPCDFAFNMLKETAVRLQKELTRDDHLVILLIRSTGTV